jgi:hypothetical protein
MDFVVASLRQNPELAIGNILLTAWGPVIVMLTKE